MLEDIPKYIVKFKDNSLKVYTPEELLDVITDLVKNNQIVEIKLT
jgi:hypothetical protein